MLFFPCPLSDADGVVEVSEPATEEADDEGVTDAGKVLGVADGVTEDVVAGAAVVESGRFWAAIALAAATSNLSGVTTSRYVHAGMDDPLDIALGHLFTK